MSGLFSKPKAPPIPPPEAPVAIPETGEAEVTKRRSMMQGGRGKTILAGQMAPANIFKKRLLG
jgi:hypothetical protein